MIPILQFLAELELELSEAPENNQSHLDVTETLRQVLQEMHSCGKSAFIYTDGSTAGGRIAKRKPNSGSSIVVTDDRNSEVWSGGMVVRTDGNNFIAELAAAVVVCQILKRRSGRC